MIDRLSQLVKENKSFAFETTLSGVTYLEFIKSAKLAGYHITLFLSGWKTFNWLRAVWRKELERVAIQYQGDVIVRRYKKGIQNFAKYASQVNEWYVFDNSGTEYILIGRFTEDREEISNFEIFSKLRTNEF